MILSAKQVRAIATGRATLVLRRQDKGPPKIGREVPIREHQEPAQCRAKATHAVAQRLSDTTYADAKAMGHKNVGIWREEWLREHDADWVKANSDSLGVLELAQIEARFTEHWADEVVWAITVQLVADPPRFLAAGKGTIDPDPVTGGNGDYTRTPARGLDREAGEYVAPSLETVKRAKEHRESFLRDLERERAERKANGQRQMKRSARVAMFKDAA